MISGRPSNEEDESDDEDTEQDSEDPNSDHEDVGPANVHAEPVSAHIEPVGAHVESDSDNGLPPLRQSWRRGAISGGHRDYHIIASLTSDPTATQPATSRRARIHSAAEASRSTRTNTSSVDEIARERTARRLPPPGSQVSNPLGLAKPGMAPLHLLRRLNEAPEVTLEGRSQHRYSRPSQASPSPESSLPEGVTRDASIRPRNRARAESASPPRPKRSRKHSQRDSHVISAPSATSSPRQYERGTSPDCNDRETVRTHRAKPMGRSDPQPPPRMRATQYQPPPPPPPPDYAETIPTGRETRSGAYLTPRGPTPLHIIASQAHSVLRQILTTLPDRERELYHRLQQSNPRMPVLEEPERDLEYDEVRPLGGREPFLGIDPIGAALEGYNETTYETRHEQAFFDELQRIGAFSEPLGTRTRLNSDRAIANRRTWVRYRQAGKVYHPGGGGRPTGWYTT